MPLAHSLELAQGIENNQFAPVFISGFSANS
ncbi:MAG: hypothetical protein ACI841_003538 [Planctomycetota bacterium]|jgi:hypothetical protein